MKRSILSETTATPSISPVPDKHKKDVFHSLASIKASLQKECQKDMELLEEEIAHTMERRLNENSEDWRAFKNLVSLLVKCHADEATKK